MGRAPCCDKANVKKGPWCPEEDSKLKDYIEKYGTGGNWISLPQKAGLKRCGKSCRLRWLNYLRPNIKHGEFTDDEDRIICTLFTSIGSRWSIIAAQLPGRTDNDIKNYWNTKLKKKLIMGIIQIPHMKPNPLAASAAAISSFYQASPSSPSFTSPSNATVLHAPLQDGFVGLNMQPLQENVLSFGGDQASCSSSDGSCSNRLSYSGELEYNYGGGGGGGDVGGSINNGNYYYNGVEDQKHIASEGSMIGNSLWEETPLDYSVEEIKRLISSNSNCNNSLSFDEYKIGERSMYY